MNTTTNPPARPTLESARNFYFQGRKGDNEAHRLARQSFEQLNASTPGDPLVENYLGSCLLIDAGRAGNFIEKARLSRRGMTLLDHARDAAPDNIEILAIRGVTLHHLPDAFGRREEAKQVIARVVRDPRFDQLHNDLQVICRRLNDESRPN